MNASCALTNVLKVDSDFKKFMACGAEEFGESQKEQSSRGATLCAQGCHRAARNKGDLGSSRLLCLKESVSDGKDDDCHEHADA
eukprot:1153699-Pelagomonas_calceolata.AAC.11